MALNFRVRAKGYLDRPKVIREIGQKNADALNHIGGFIKVTMQRSMRQSAATQPHSEPGVPPRYTRKFIRGDRVSRNNRSGPHAVKYHVEKQSGGWNLIVGPEYMSGQNTLVNPIGKTKPQLLNEGGIATGTGQYVILDTVRNRLIDPWSRGGAIIMARLHRAQSKASSQTRSGQSSKQQQSGSSPTQSPNPTTGQPAGGGRGQKTTRPSGAGRRRKRGSSSRHSARMRTRNRYKEIWINAGQRMYPARNFTAEPLAKAITHGSLQRAWRQVG